MEAKERVRSVEKGQYSLLVTAECSATSEPASCSWPGGDRPAFSDARRAHFSRQNDVPVFDADPPKVCCELSGSAYRRLRFRTMACAKDRKFPPVAMAPSAVDSALCRFRPCRCLVVFLVWKMVGRICVSRHSEVSLVESKSDLPSSAVRAPTCSLNCS